jgi:hypothetical protein
LARFLSSTGAVFEFRPGDQNPADYHSRFVFSVRLRESASDLCGKISDSDDEIEEDFYDSALRFHNGLKISSRRLRKVFKHRTTYKNGILRLDCKVYPPASERDEIIWKAHGDAHLNSTDVYTVLKTMNIRWKHMYHDIVKLLPTCTECAAMNCTLAGAVKDLKSIPLSSLQWSAIDFTGPFPRSLRGFTHIFVLVERFTGFIFALPSRGTSDDEVIQSLIPFIYFFGKSGSVISSANGFKRNIKSWLESFGISLRNASVLYPKGSFAETAIHSLKPLIEKHSLFSPLDWDIEILRSISSLNNKPRIHGLSSFDMLFGRLSHLSQTEFDNKDDMKTMLQHMTSHHKLHQAILADRIIKAEQHEEFESSGLSRGEIVFIQSQPKSKRQNLQPRNIGPFILIYSGPRGGCVIRLQNGELRRTHRSQIRGTGLVMKIQSEFRMDMENIDEFAEDDINLALRSLNKVSPEDADYLPEEDPSVDEETLPHQEHGVHPRRSPRFQSKRQIGLTTTRFGNSEVFPQGGS